MMFPCHEVNPILQNTFLAQYKRWEKEKKEKVTFMFVRTVILSRVTLNQSPLFLHNQK